MNKRRQLGLPSFYTRWMTTRVRALNDAPPSPSGQFVLYWMTAARRLRWNFSLQRAVDRAREFNRPLIILEALRCDYPFASDRLHQFVLDGMADNARDAGGSRASYYAYVEPSKGAGRGLIEALSRHACVIVTDWYPAFFLPRMLSAAARKVRVRLEAVDSNGLIPLAEHQRAFTTARSYRAFAQRVLRDHVRDVPDENPLLRLPRGLRAARIPAEVRRRWLAADARLLAGGQALSDLPIDHSVKAVDARGGRRKAEARLERFVDTRLDQYGDKHNHPDEDGTSRLSPYLHFGHISAHQVFSTVMTRERWTTRKLAKRGGGAREGWWGVSPSAETFLDQLVVWRELAFNGCEYIADYAKYDSLPEWSRATLRRHASDRRPHIYSIDQLESASTVDEVWNAAQRQMVAEGWFHGYLRMLWGKKILEWSRDPGDALTTMRTLMDRYSLDGRDPNSYANYAWVLGRYDRPWPERPIFGTVRYMTSQSTRRKLKMKKFLERYGDPTSSTRVPARRR
jgi:deoxyribodipyrimidine photo-lyase